MYVCIYIYFEPNTPLELERTLKKEMTEKATQALFLFFLPFLCFLHFLPLDFFFFFLEELELEELLELEFVSSFIWAWCIAAWTLASVTPVGKVLVPFLLPIASFSAIAAAALALPRSLCSSELRQPL